MFKINDKYYLSESITNLEGVINEILKDDLFFDLDINIYWPDKVFHILYRYPDDVYDRFWYPWRPRDDPTYSKISTTFSIEQSALFAVPSTILQTAVVPVGKSTVLTITTRQDKTLDDVMVFLHLADFQNGDFRQFDAYIDDELFGTYNPQYNIGDSNFSNFWYSSTEDSKYNLTLAATAKSKLPPMLNAFEVYGRIAHDNPTTFSQDCKLISLEHTKPIKIHAMALHQTISKKQPCQQHSKKITQIFLIIKRIWPLLQKDTTTYYIKYTSQRA